MRLDSVKQNSEGLTLSLSARVAILGAGTMGRGIALVAAKAGHTVMVYDISTQALEQCEQQLRKSLGRMMENGHLSADEMAACRDRLIMVSSLDALSDVRLLIEALPEDIELKAKVLRQIEAALPVDAIVATNTSSLSVTELATRLSRPAQVAGMHFFNPAQLMPLVEIVSGHITSKAVADTLFATAKAWGKTPVHCLSTPGFIVNRIARPFYGEALRLLTERVTDAATLDAIYRDCGGFRMGPCELMDLIGHDVNFAVTNSLFRAFYEDARFRPSPLQKTLIEAGRLGRKSGHGFYDYTADAERPQPRTAAPGTVPDEIRIEGEFGAEHRLIALARKGEFAVIESATKNDAQRGVIKLRGMQLALTDGRTATQRSHDDGIATVLFDLAFDYANSTRIALATPFSLSAAELDVVVGFFQKLGKSVSIIEDTPGMIVMRTVAMLINEAADVLQQDVASAGDIDLAMQQGVNYPQGPLAWADRIGPQTVLQVITHLADYYREERYRVSPLLRAVATAHQTFHTGVLI